jgi:hypothetical protein
MTVQKRKQSTDDKAAKKIKHSDAEDTESTENTTPIISYAVEISKTSRDRCQACKKNIPRRALRFGRLVRANRRVKKRDAQTEWWHQACFEVRLLLQL